MSGRPEEEGGTYDAGRDYDPDAWKEFTPWRPGDPSTRDEAPMSASDPTLEGRRWNAEERSTSAAGAAEQRERAGGEPQRRGRWWTEDVPRRYEAGDRVRNQRAAGTGMFSTVQPGTRGEVVSTRHGLFGDDFATVRFENGYTEEVRTDALERRGWLD